MNPESFAYQTAIQQITEQEQGQACLMLSVFKDCWLYKYHYTLWNDFIVIGFAILQLLIILIGFTIIGIANEWGDSL